MMRICIECETEFNPNSIEKKRARGNINHCPECSTDNAPVLRCVNSADGKMANSNILRFNSVDEADAFSTAWKRTTGHNNGKSCQMRNTMALDLAAMSFTQVAYIENNSNHKGKA